MAGRAIPPRFFRLGLWFLCTGAVIIVASLLASHFADREAIRTITPARPTKIEAKFDLVDHTGKKVAEADFRGRFLIVFFGFTSCPDVCTATLTAITDVMARLGKDGERVVPLFITLDPERDTPARIAEYLKPFDPRIRGLTGSVDQVKAAQKAFRVHSERVASGDGKNYTTVHSTLVYFMGPDGAYLANFSHQMRPVKIVERLRPWM